MSRCPWILAPSIAVRSIAVPSIMVPLIMVPLIVVLIAGAGLSRAQHLPKPGHSEGQARVRQTVSILARDYDPSNGLWKTEGWWNAANTVTALGDAAALDPEIKTQQTLSHTFKQAQKKKPLFRNEFYDDEGWWALAWIQAYDLTHQRRYLAMSESIFQDMSAGWDDTCGGGIWWKKDRHYKNAIANELFLSVAAHLANRAFGKSRAPYQAWAQREWTWFESSGMINGESLVNDGLTPDCKNNGKNTWTYNQGVLLGGLVELSKATGDRSYRQKADCIASAAIQKLSDADGILHDKTEPDCSADSVQFKGIFMRNLGQLQQDSPSETYASFLRSNGEAIWSKARNGDQGFACSWSGPPRNDGAAALTSALDALIASLLAPAPSQGGTGGDESAGSRFTAVKP